VVIDRIDRLDDAGSNFDASRHLTTGLCGLASD
jgi:hypothetical protein